MRTSETRLLVSEVLQRIERHDAYAAIAFDACAFNSNLSKADINIAKEILFGVLRNRTRLENAISVYLSKPLNRTNPHVRRQMLIAAYQILFMDNIPPEMAVNRCVEIVKRKFGSKVCGFVNATLRKLVKEGENLDESTEITENIEKIYSFPKWIGEMFVNSVGEEKALELAKALNQRGKLNLRANVTKNKRKTLVKKLKKQFPALILSETEYSPVGVNVKGFSDPIRQPLHKDGSYLIQNEGSQLVSYFVNPQKGEKILDACAGTGGKSIHMAALTNNEAEIFAIDLKPSKMDALLQRSKRAGFDCIKTKSMNLLTQSPDQLFDRVLLDAPCSGLGILRRHPEAKWRLKKEQIDELATLQKSLFERMAPLVKPGGILVYVVCTFNCKETTGQVDHFLENNKEFELIGPPKQSDVNWNPLINDRGMYCSFPHIHDTDGFFAARLKRKG
jgi:16S rRNA (cytosine967-C5)-methyltransferase